VNKLTQLSKMTTVVADTGDIQSIKQYKPTDATTNPSLLYKAAQLPQYKELVEAAIHTAQSKAKSKEDLTRMILDQLAVNFGVEILGIIPGRISTEVDARLSFDSKGTIKRAEEIIQLYESAGIDRNRVLIKVASTWEGIRAANELEKIGIHCNLTLLFSFAQAVACAEAGVTLISPFVGRILDWYKKSEGVDGYPGSDDPGVKSVTAIYNYFKKHGYPTEIMGASFRNTEEILELAGCDLLTIAPSLMEELQNATGDVPKKLDLANVGDNVPEKIHLTENDFRWELNSDAMATEKLAEGIRSFTADAIKLEKLVEEMGANL